MPFSKAKSVETAAKALKRGQYDRAIAEFERIVRQDPSDIRSKLKLGDLYIRDGQTEDAIRVLHEVATHYSEQGFTLKAVAVYKQILKLNPEMAEVSVALASHYQQQGLLTEAVRQYKDAARIYAQRGRILERLNVIRSMVELDSDNVADRIRLAESYSSAGRYNEAVALFRDACRILESRNRPALYCKVAERLLHHQPDDFAVNRQLAAYYLKDHDAQRALPKLRACYRQQPRDLEVLEMLQETFELLGQTHKAVSVLREMARIYGENGLLEEREHAYERILELSQEDSEARRALRIVSAVDDQQAIFEFDESQPGTAIPEPPDEEDGFDVVEGDVSVLDAPPRLPTLPQDRAVAVETGATPPPAPPSEAIPAPPPTVEAPRHDAALEEIFGDLDLDADIDIHEDGEDTIVVGDVPLEELDDFDLDDGLDDVPSAPVLPASRSRADDDWDSLIGQPAGRSTVEGSGEFGDFDQDIDLEALMREAERAVAGESAPPVSPAPKPAAVSTGVDLALAEALEEVDFYVSNELNSDAIQLLEELRAEYPEHPEIQGRLARLRRK